MSTDFDAAMYRASVELATLADLHLATGSRDGTQTARAAWAGAGALLEALCRDLPAERMVTRGTLGLQALTHYTEAGLAPHAQRLAVRLLQSDMEPSKRAAIARMRGSRPVECFQALREDWVRAAA